MKLKLQPKQAYVLYASLGEEIKPLFAVSATANLSLARSHAEDSLRAVTGEAWDVGFATRESAIKQGIAFEA